MENFVCRSYDSYLEDRDKTVWIITLSDGSVVFQDDERYGPEDRAWNRLKTYVREASLRVQSVKLKFRSHTETVFDDLSKAEGVFFSNAIGCWIGQKPINYYIMGYIENSVLYTQKCRVPELIFEESEERVPKDSECLLWFTQANTEQTLP